MYSSDGNNVCGSRVEEFEGIGLLYGLKVVKSCSQVALPVHLFRHFCCRMYGLDTIHFVTFTVRDIDTVCIDDAS